ncbi:hypothetical protein Asppvi_003809 [Aspergillus pseudoviridinutans]|uniref:Uncharacterized protein n=1 Tax=Aspergillus pseudoviridinutans TaxID=1517512 RepID=A0A9P3ERE5_9EURO|nr:uncharacterized protein Asppvi_003809 [Aspergillus pseudoviridinutans]GIJ84954.1 hypothetical protein Asppvi_003809 [Aspergillus pseudoviridinutans]
MVKPQGRRLFAITYSGTSNETSTPGTQHDGLEPMANILGCNRTTWRIKNSVGAYPQVSSPKYVSPRLRAAFQFIADGDVPHGNETAKSYLQASPNNDDVCKGTKWAGSSH